jgi:hypothetical protein
VLKTPTYPEYGVSTTRPSKRRVAPENCTSEGTGVEFEYVKFMGSTRPTFEELKGAKTIWPVGKRHPPLKPYGFVFVLIFVRVPT